MPTADRHQTYLPNYNTNFCHCKQCPHSAFGHSVLLLFTVAVIDKAIYFQTHDLVTKPLTLKHIKHMNSFQIAVLQIKLRKFSEIPLSGSGVSDLGYNVY